MKITRQLHIFVLAVAVGSPAVAGAQDFVPSTPPSALAAVSAVSPALRLARLEERAREEPARYEVLTEAAREGAWLAVSVENREARIDMIVRARSYAERAKATDPNGVEGRYWLAVTSGLLAEEEEGRTKIGLAEEAYREASWVLEVDSLHAGAHHILGRLHAAVMRLNRILRFLARQFIGGEVLGEASWDKAAYHLRRAAELSPEEPVHHLELGVAYLDMGRTADARVALSNTVAAKPLHPADRRYRARAEALLAGLAAANDD